MLLRLRTYLDSRINEGFDEMRERLIDVAEMDFEDFTPFTEVTDGFNDIFAHQFAAFEPATDTETHADVRAIRDFEGAFIAIEATEDASRNSGKMHRGRGRPDEYQSSHRLPQPLAQPVCEVGVVIPNFRFTVFTTV